MPLTLTFVLVAVAMVVTLRMMVWWGLLLISRLFSTSVAVAERIRVSPAISRLGSRIRTSFPGVVKWLSARLTPSQYTGLPLTLLVIAAFYIAALLLGLIEELLEADALVRFDKAMNQQLDAVRTDGLISAFLWITDLAGSATLVAVVSVATGLLWAYRRSTMVASLWLTIIGAQITTLVGKYVFQRQRPAFVADVVAVTPSFPSGHATSAMAVYGFIAYSICRADGMATWQRVELTYWTAVLIGLIGFSRMFLGVHYASDVAAGLLVGGFWLLVGFAFAEHRRHKHAGATRR